MVVPAIGRELAAADGGRLAATAAIVIGTLIVPRPAGGWLHPQAADRIINGVFRLATRNIPGLQAAGRAVVSGLMQGSRGRGRRPGHSHGPAVDVDGAGGRTGRPGMERSRGDAGGRDPGPPRRREGGGQQHSAGRRHDLADVAAASQAGTFPAGRSHGTRRSAHHPVLISNSSIMIRCSTLAAAEPVPLRPVVQ